MTLAAETYAQLFDTVAQSEEIKQLAKVANFWSHPATAYSLGALGLGLGLPVAYSLGQRAKKEELDAERGRAFVAGLHTPVPTDAMMGYQPEDGVDPEGMYADEAYANNTEGDYIPDENAMNYYGMEPGVEDVYGANYPEFGSYE